MSSERGSHRIDAGPMGNPIASLVWQMKKMLEIQQGPKKKKGLTLNSQWHRKAGLNL